MLKILFTLIVIGLLAIGGYFYMQPAEQQSGRPEISNAKKEKIIVRGDIMVNDINTDGEAMSDADKIDAELMAINKAEQ